MSILTEIGQRISGAFKAMTGGYPVIISGNDNLGRDYTKTGSGYNEYKSYSRQIQFIDLKYNSQADYGCQLVKTIIDFRAAWILGKVPTISVEGEREQEFVDSFMKFNGWDGSKLLNYAKLGEKEGKVLKVLTPEKTVTGETKIRCKAYKYITYNYQPVFDPFYNLIGITYSYGYPPKQQYITPDSFVLTFLSGDIETDLTMNLISPPRIAHIMHMIDQVDRAERDRAKINSIFAKPTPVFKMKTADAAKKVVQYIDNRTWEIGRAIVLEGDGEMEMVTPDMKGTESLQKEIINNIQRITGHSGVPVFLVGYPELMNGRATAAEFAESINVMTTTERTTWEGSLAETVQKAMIMHNRVNSDYLDPSTVTVKIPEVSLSQVKLMLDTLSEMKGDGNISRQTYLELNPVIKNPVEEMRRLDAEAGKVMEQDQAVTDKLMSGLKDMNSPGKNQMEGTDNVQ